MVEFKFDFKIEGSEHQFRVEHFEVTEALSTPFHVRLSLISNDHDIISNSLMRKTGLLTLYGQGSDQSRVFHGTVNEVHYLGLGRRFSRYYISLVPTFWFLTQRQDCRIFQNKTIPEIIKEVLTDAKISNYVFSKMGNYPKKEYVLQYRETDCHFLERLFSENGMWYYFEHTNKNHIMVIVDSNDAIEKLNCTEKNASYNGAIKFSELGGIITENEHIHTLTLMNRVRSGKVTYRDHNYEKPNIPQEAFSQGNLDQDLALFDYPGRYNHAQAGKAHASHWLEEHLVDNQQISASSDVMRLATGYCFYIEDHPRSAINQEYTLLSIHHSGDDPSVHEEERSGMPSTYQNNFCCIPRSVSFKAPKMPAPTVDGPQTAIVVGPQSEEIHTDKLGRIKVKFHWDRDWKNENDPGCWIRVSQSMAGTNFGAVYLPRIGHEVIVTFLEGDPDRPLVTGCVYNGLHFPPYSLPENKTRTTFRTQTHKGKGFNELSFEDEANKEEVYIHAQKDMSTKVGHCCYRDVAQDEFLNIGRHQTNKIAGDQKESIDGDKISQIKSTFTETVEQDVTVTYNANETQYVKNNTTLKVGEGRDVTVMKNDRLDVGENYNLTVGASRVCEINRDDNQYVKGNLTVNVDTNISFKSDSSIQIISADKIILKTGNASLVMSKDGKITLSGTSISIEGDDKVVVKGGKVVINQ